MRRPAWNGSPPSDDVEARELLVAAAARCIASDGLDKTSITSIAREAGVTRQTVYRYFESGEAIVAEVEIRAGGGILRGWHDVARRYRKRSAKVVETLVYLYREVPRDPLLGPYFTGTGARLADDPHLTSVAIAAASANVKEAFGISRPTKAQQRQLDRLAELAIRLLASFLSHPGEHRRSEEELRDFMYEWLAPSIDRVFGTTR